MDLECLGQVCAGSGRPYREEEREQSPPCLRLGVRGWWRVWEPGRLGGREGGWSGQWQGEGRTGHQKAQPGGRPEAAAGAGGSRGAGPRPRWELGMGDERGAEFCC